VNSYDFKLPSMDLPQTDAGVPAPGIDPTIAELAAISSLAEVFNWLGTAEPARTALCESLGGGTPRLRDLVYIKGSDWDNAIGSITVPDGVDGSRQLTPIETGHMDMLRRIARLRLGLRAVEDTGQQAVGLQFGGVGLGGIPATTATLAVPNNVPPNADAKLKLSIILDPSMDSDLHRLPHAQVRGLFNAYAKTRGAEPAEDVEPTVEQISAVAQVVASDLVPYADFALLGPHGRRLVGKLSYLAWTFQPDGTWHRKELPGPPSFEHWWASFRVLRTIFLLLDIAPPELLDNYGEMLRGFHSLYGPSAWFLIYTADVRMRSEHFDRLRRFAERDHDAAVASGLTSTFNPAKPWHATFKAALADKLWWDENLHRPSILFLTRVKSAGESVSDGTVQDLVTIPSWGAGQSSRPRSRSRQAQRAGRRGQQQQGGDNRQGGGGSRPGAGQAREGYTRAGVKICGGFNSANGCSRPNCNECHICSGCKQSGHSVRRCPADRRHDPPQLTPRSATPRSSKGGGGGGKGKGKGQRH
jgi:hypothetical protein